MTRNEIERIAVERIGPDDGSRFYQYRLFNEKKKVYYEYATIRFGPFKGRRYRELNLEYLLYVKDQPFLKKLGKWETGAVNSAIWHLRQQKKNKMKGVNDGKN
jgi:hypothetical protein